MTAAETAYIIICLFKFVNITEFDLTEIKTMEDFRKLPFTDKGDLRDAYPLGIAAVPELPIFFKINSLIFMPVFGLNNGVVPIIAYNYGAQNRKRMTETIKRSVAYASTIMIFGMIVFLTVPQLLMKIFSAGNELMAVGVPCLRIISLSFALAGACIALGSSMQALGKSIYSMINSIVRQLVVLIPAAFLLARYGVTVGNSNLVWWSYPIAEIAALAVTIGCFIHVYKTIISKIPLNGIEKPQE